VLGLDGFQIYKDRRKESIDLEINRSWIYFGTRVDSSNDTAARDWD
jgi:hypothetical protein